MGAMHRNRTATESVCNANEARDARKQASWDEVGLWEAEEDQSKEASPMNKVPIFQELE